MKDLGNKIGMLIAAAGLTEQHRCIKCRQLLCAFGRAPEDKWSCPTCNVPGTTVARIEEPRTRS